MVYSFNGWRLAVYVLLYFAAAGYFKIVGKKKGLFLVYLAVMWIYFGVVINLTLFPIHAVEGYGEQFMGGQNVWKEMNLIPFRTGVDKSCLMNIVMTLPLGFGLPFLIGGSFKKIGAAGGLCGILLELGQLLTALYAGYTFRQVDINDIICNFLGTVIGWSLFRLAAAIVAERFPEHSILCRLFP